MIIKLFFAGRDFYMKSGTIMGIIYEVGTYKRWNYGSMEIALDQGHEVMIRPAQKEELQWAKQRLKEVIEEYEGEKRG